MNAHNEQQGYTAADMADQAAAAFERGRDSVLAERAAAAPEGFVLVPVEPTVKMIQSACIASNAGNMYLRNDVRMLGVWSAMLAARPQGVKYV